MEKMSYNLIQLPALQNGESLQDVQSLLVFSITSANAKGIVGRHSTCEFRIKSDEHPVFVSRKHTRLSMKEGKLYVEDLSSANGTYVNNEKLEALSETPVKAGDCVAFGSKNKSSSIVDENDMPFRFKVHEIKMTTVRPTMKTKSFKSDHRRVKKTDEPDSGFDDVESQPCVKKRRSSFVYGESAAAKSDVAPSSANCSRKSMPEDTITILRKRQKKKKSYREGDSEDEEDAVLTEECSSFECVFRSKGNDAESSVVSWVQCDSCDRWFHTVCVGCDYDKVRLASHQFHCGLC